MLCLTIRALALVVVLGGFGAGRLRAQFAGAAEITQVSEVGPVGKEQRSDQKLVATGFRALAEKDKALMTKLQAAPRLDGLPWNLVSKQLLRSKDGKTYLLRMGEDGETFGLWKCVRVGKRYSVPWEESDPYLGCFQAARAAGPPAESAAGKKPAPGVHLVIQMDPVGAGLEKYRQTFCDLRGDSPEMKDFLEKLWVEHGERYAGRDVSYYGPDHPAVVIGFEKDGRRFALRSWHATYRKNPRVIGTATGITTRDTAEERQKLFAEQPAEYRQFVGDFDAILQAAERKLGTPFDL